MDPSSSTPTNEELNTWLETTGYSAAEVDELLARKEETPASSMEAQKPHAGGW